MNILQVFKAKFAVFAAKAADQINTFAHFFLPAVGQLIEVAIEDIAAIAGQAVLAQAPKVISGDQKFGNAVSAVIDAVRAEGKTVAQQTAGAAVQLAYLEIQKIAQGK